MVALAGYANGVAAGGFLVFTGRQVGWNENEELVGDDFLMQVERPLSNIVTILPEGGRRIIEKCSYKIGQVYHQIIGRHFGDNPDFRREPA